MIWTLNEVPELRGLTSAEQHKAYRRATLKRLDNWLSMAAIVAIVILVLGAVDAVPGLLGILVLNFLCLRLQRNYMLGRVRPELISEAERIRAARPKPA